MIFVQQGTIELYKAKKNRDGEKKVARKIRRKSRKIKSWNRFFELVCTKALIKKIAKGKMELK